MKPFSTNLHIPSKMANFVIHKFLESESSSIQKARDFPDTKLLISLTKNKSFSHPGTNVLETFINYGNIK